MDIFIKLRHPQTNNIYLLTEVKTGKASRKDFQQLQKYISEFGNECKGGILIAKDFPRRISISDNIIKMKYSFEDLDCNSEYTFGELLDKLKIEVM